MTPPNNRLTWKRRQVVGMAAGALAGMGLYRLNFIEPVFAEEKSITMGIGVWIGFTPYHIAEAKGFFKDAGVASLDTKVFNSGADSTAAFLGGRTDGDGTVTSSAVTYAAKGKDFRVVLVEDQSLGADGILARNSVKDIKDFKGKKIAVEKGGVSHFFLLQVLAEVGLTEKDVTLVNVNPDAAAAAYQSGNAEIAVTWAPYLAQALDAQKDGKLIYDSSKMPTAIADLYVFDAKFTEENPELVESFVRGVLKGLEFLKTNPDEGLAIAAKPLGTTPEDLKEQLKGVSLPDLDTNLEMLGNPESDLYMLKPMKALAEFLKAQGQIDEIPDMSKVLEPKFVKAIKANA